MTDAPELRSSEPGLAGASGVPDPRSGGVWRGAGLAVVLLVTLALASAWLVFPYFFEGRNLLQDVGGEVMSARIAEERTTGQAVTRYAFGPGEAETSVLFGTETYFRALLPRG